MKTIQQMKQNKSKPIIPTWCMWLLTAVAVISLITYQVITQPAQNQLHLQTKLLAYGLAILWLIWTALSKRKWAFLFLFSAVVTSLFAGLLTVGGLLLFGILVVPGYFMMGLHKES